MYNVLVAKKDYKMGIGIIACIVLIIGFIILKNIISFGLRIIGFGLILLITGVTIWICSEQPDMHKPFSIETIEYLFKINKDGSMTTTKEVTQTVVK